MAQGALYMAPGALYMDQGALAVYGPGALYMGQGGAVKGPRGAAYGPRGALRDATALHRAYGALYGCVRSPKGPGASLGIGRVRIVARKFL